MIICGVCKWRSVCWSRSKSTRLSWCDWLGEEVRGAEYEDEWTSDSVDASQSEWKWEAGPVGVSECLVEWMSHEMREFATVKAKLTYSGLILGLRPANERCRYKIAPSLIGWAQMVQLTFKL